MSARLLTAFAAMALPAGLIAQSTGAGAPAATPIRPSPPGIAEIAAPAIDGRLDDAWQAVPALPLETRAGDTLGHVRLAYDSSALYAVVAVPDDTLTFPERSWRFGDGFYLTVLMPGTGAASDQHVSLGLSRVGGRLETTVVNRSGQYFPRHPLHGVRLAASPDPRSTPELSAGANPWGRDIVYEVAVPWSVLAPADPLTVDSLAVNVVAVDRDGGTARRFGMLTPDPAFDTERTPVRRGRMLPLVRRGPVASARLGLRVDAPIVRAGTQLDITLAVRWPSGSAGHGSDAAASGTPASGRLTVELVRGGSAVATGEATVPRHGLQRVRIPMAVGDIGTGPVVLGARLDGGPAAKDTLFVVEDAELAAVRRRLESVPAGSPSAAAVPTVLLRLQELGAFAATAAANTPIGPAAKAWDELRELADELAAGSVALLRTPGLHRLAHRSGVDGSIQPYSVYLPGGLRADSARPLLLVLHGSGVTEAGTIRAAGPAGADRGWIVVAPRGRGLSDWYVGPAEADVLEALAHARSLYPVDPDRVLVAGFSMGGYGSWRLLARHASRFRAGAVLAGAACPPESTGGRCVDALLADRPADAPRPSVLVVHGARDHAVPVDAARGIIERLEAVGWPHEYLEIDDAGHGGPGWWMRALDWLQYALTEHGG